MEIIDLAFLLFNLLAIYLSLVWIIIYISNRKTILRYPRTKKFPAITFIVPAFNEEKNIEKCLNSILNVDYPSKFKILVINDGSTDKTAEVVKKFEKYGVRLVNKKRGGKAVALNFAMKFVNTDFVACLDADTYVTKDYLKKMMGYFKDENVAAVTPSTKVSKITNFVYKLQWAEYALSLILRKLFALFDCQFTVPGVGSVFRTSVLRDVGLFDENSLTEDMEIALRLQTRGYKIENSLISYVYTECPKDFVGLFKQRMRWYRGYIENFKKYSKEIFDLKSGNLSIFLPTTIIWISFIIFMLLLQVLSLSYSFYNSVTLWKMINYAIMLPSISLELFKIDSMHIALSLSLFIGLVMVVLGIKTSGIEKIKGKKLSYLIYIILYPYFFAFMWFCAIVLEFLGVRKRW